MLHQRPQARTGAMEPNLAGSKRDAERGRDLLVGEAAHVGEHDDFGVVLGELPDELPDSRLRAGESAREHQQWLPTGSR